MLVINRSENKYVIRMDRGDLWPNDFVKLCMENKIRSAFFYGLGAMEDVTLAYYDLMNTKKYIEKKFKGLFELLNITGNISNSEDNLSVHNHVTLSKDDYSVFGGHLIHGKIGGTMELSLDVINSKIKRRKDKSTGLYLLDEVV